MTIGSDVDDKEPRPEELVRALAELRAEGPYTDIGLERERQRMIDLCQQHLQQAQTGAGVR